MLVASNACGVTNASCALETLMMIPFGSIGTAHKQRVPAIHWVKLILLTYTETSMLSQGSLSLIQTKQKQPVTTATELLPFRPYCVGGPKTHFSVTSFVALQFRQWSCCSSVQICLFVRALCLFKRLNPQAGKHEYFNGTRRLLNVSPDI